jgi:C1A family cysteine protease
MNNFTPGVIQSPPDSRDWLYTKLASPISLPKKHRCKITPLPPRDQGSKGTCVGQAGANTNEILQYTERGTAERLSSLYIYSMCKQVDGYPEIEGTFLRALMQVLTKYGAPPETYMPYHTSWITPPEPDDTFHTLARPNRVKSYAKVQTEQELKQALIEQGPVPIAMMLTASFFEARNGVVPKEPSGTILGGHAMTLIGYDDESKLYEVINSWGYHPSTKAGHNFIPYELLHKPSLTINLPMPVLMEAYSVVDMIQMRLPRQVLVSDRQIQLKLNGEFVDLDIPAVIIEDVGRAYFPIRELEKLGFTVQWTELTSMIELKK